jgi:hypothetical protein
LVTDHAFVYEVHQGLGHAKDENTCFINSGPRSMFSNVAQTSRTAISGEAGMRLYREEKASWQC